MTCRRWVMVVAMVIASTTTASASLGETELTAALVYRFATFVEWPPAAIGEGPVVIGVLGANKVADALETMVEGRTIEGRSLMIESLDDVRAASRCHIVFLGSNARNRRDALLAALGAGSVLTLSDSDRFARQGGMVEFVRRDRSLVFEIHRGALAQAGLRINPAVLGLAEKVYGNAPADIP